MLQEKLFGEVLFAQDLVRAGLDQRRQSDWWCGTRLTPVGCELIAGEGEVPTGMIAVKQFDGRVHLQALRQQLLELVSHTLFEIEESAGDGRALYQWLLQHQVRRLRVNDCVVEARVVTTIAGLSLEVDISDGVMVMPAESIRQACMNGINQYGEVAWLVGNHSVVFAGRDFQ